MRSIPLFIFAFLISMGSLFAQNFASIKNNQVLPLREVNSISIDLQNSNVEINRTKGAFVMVETKIKLYETDFHILEHLNQTGRYDVKLEKQKDAQHVSLVEKTSLPTLRISGKTIKEEISYVIHVPERVHLRESVLALSFQ